MAQKIIPVTVSTAIHKILNTSADPEQAFFVFDADSAINKGKELRNAIQRYFDHYKLYVSLKSCALGIFNRLLADEGFGAEACSVEEILAAQSAGFSSDQIAFDGPLKFTEELDFAVRNNILIHVDSLHELKRISLLSKRLNCNCKVGIRLSHWYRKGQRSRFGMTIDEYKDKAIQYFSENPLLQLSGFHLHTGSNQRTSDKILDNLSEWLVFLKEHLPSGGHLNLGSGFPADSFSSDASVSTPSFDEFFSDIKAFLEKNAGEIYKNWCIVFEPGRCLSEDHGYYIGMVFNSKRRNGIDLLQTNLAINWIPSIHSWHHSLSELAPSKKVSATSQQMLVGFNCFENDCLSSRDNNYSFTADNHFIVRGCGAYDLQTATQWTRIKPHIYALCEGNIITARIKKEPGALTEMDLYHRPEKITVHSQLSLVSPSSHHVSKLYRIIKENREYFSQFMNWPGFVTSEADTASFLDDCLLNHQKNKSKTYVILYENAPVGLISFNDIDITNKVAYLGYWLDSKQQGKGIVSQSVNAMVRHFSDNEMIRRFVIQCSISNRASNEVAKRCGFALEGTLIQAEKISGQFHDQNIYSLVIEECSS